MSRVLSVRVPRLCGRNPPLGRDGAHDRRQLRVDTRSIHLLRCFQAKALKAVAAASVQTRPVLLDDLACWFVVEIGSNGVEKSQSRKRKPGHVRNACEEF